MWYEIISFVVFLAIVWWLAVPESEYTKETWEAQMKKDYDEQKWLEYQETDEFKKSNN